MLILIALVLAVPGIAQAHAAVVSSQPEPGAELATAPGVVVLTFTEPLNPALSRATVVDPTGASTEGRPSGEREIRVPLTTNAPGIYEVDWVSVSTLDGHTLRGSFGFGVGVAPGPGAEGETATSPQRSDLVVAIFRAIEYGSLLLAIGLLALGWLGRRAGLDPSRPPIRSTLTIALVSGLAVVAGEALTAAGSPSFGAIVDYLTTGPSGAARSARVIAETLAVVAAWLGRGVVWFLLVAVVSLAASGHAAAVDLGVPVDALHLLSAGVWAGGILALGLLRPEGGWRGPARRALLERFSSAAIPAFVLTVATGTLRGVQELSALRDLVATPYGQVLGVKVVAVAAMVPLSVLAWRRVLGTPRLEAGLAVIVIGVAAVLAAFPLPPGRVAETDEAKGPRASVSALPRGSDLTIADDAGQVLVGLTVRPAEPGPNEVLVYLLPLAGEDAAGELPATIRIGGRTTGLESCGPTCRRTQSDLRGGEMLTVEVGTGVGGTASFRLPELPAPDGSGLFERAQARMHELRTYKVDEVLSSGLGRVEASYAYAVPSSYAARVIREGEVVSESIVIGETRYLRSQPGMAWDEQPGGPELEVPTFIWDSFLPAVGTRILGSERLDGRRTKVVTFAGSGSLPIWFRLWIDDLGVVHRAEMRAQGHFMDHRYFAFDTPIVIEPPV